MPTLTACHADSMIHRLDPRVRIVAAVAFSVVVAAADRPPVLAWALGLALLAVLVARLPATVLLRRLSAVGLFLVMLLVVLPLSTPGGLSLAIMIGLRALAIVIMFSALISTIDIVSLGHALHHLKLPDKLVGLLMLGVRYEQVIADEYRRLRTAMRIRAFEPRVNRRTYRTIGYLAGTLLVRGFDRAERVAAAMRCRGFTGRLHMIDHFRLHRCDAVFAVLTVAVCAALAWGQWR